MDACCRGEGLFPDAFMNFLLAEEGSSDESKARSELEGKYQVRCWRCSEHTLLSCALLEIMLGAFLQSCSCSSLAVSAEGSEEELHHLHAACDMYTRCTLHTQLQVTCLLCQPGDDSRVQPDVLACSWETVRQQWLSCHNRSWMKLLAKMAGRSSQVNKGWLKHVLIYVYSHRSE